MKGVGASVRDLRVQRTLHSETPCHPFQIEFDLLKDLRERFDALDIGAVCLPCMHNCSQHVRIIVLRAIPPGGDGWIDLEEFNMVLTFNKFKTTEQQPGLYFHEFKNMVRIGAGTGPFFR